MVDSPTVELGFFLMEKPPAIDDRWERDGVIYRITLIQDEGGLIGGAREFRLFGVATDE